MVSYIHLNRFYLVSIRSCFLCIEHLQDSTTMSLSERALKQNALKQQSLQRCNAMQQEIDKLKAEQVAREFEDPYVFVLIDTHAHKVHSYSVLSD